MLVSSSISIISVPLGILFYEIQVSPFCAAAFAS